MVELYQFLLFNRDQRADYLWENGDFVISVKENDYSYSLYSLNGYYVEVRISNADSSITDIIPFKKGELLEKYLEYVDMSRLLPL